MNTKDEFGVNQKSAWAGRPDGQERDRPPIAAKMTCVNHTASLTARVKTKNRTRYRRYKVIPIVCINYTASSSMRVNGRADKVNTRMCQP